VIPDLGVEIVNKKFKKRGLRHLIELERDKNKEPSEIESVADLEEREYTANDEVPYKNSGKEDFSWIKEIADSEEEPAFVYVN